jgi:hypothetical protein
MNGIYFAVRPFKMLLTGIITWCCAEEETKVWRILGPK